jgi:uncharacterized RDD family membrane protein YckC
MEAPMESPSLREQGMQALEQGDLDRAIDFLARAVMADDRDAESKALLGVAYSQKGLHAQAQRALQTAIELEPGNPNYRFNLGVVMERAGSSQDAAAAYREVLRIDPGHTQAQARLQAVGGTAVLPPSEQPTVAAPPPAEPAPAPGIGAPSPPPGTPGYGAPGYGAPGTGLPPPTLGTPAGYGAPPPPGAAAGFPPGGAIGMAPQPMTTGEAFGRRFAAYLIDYIIVSVVACIPTFPIAFVMGVGAAAAGEGAVEGVQIIAQLLGSVIYLVVAAVYGGYMYSSRGQTLGKMALGIRVNDSAGNNPSFIQGALRESVLKMVSSCICLLGFFWMLWDPEQQALHDKIVGTRVVRA